MINNNEFTSSQKGEYHKNGYVFTRELFSQRITGHTFYWHCPAKSKFLATIHTMLP
jgi:hypothetical protein